MATSTTKIGFIGTGVMGASMAGHLLAAGHEIVVHSRTMKKAQPLIERGARWADSPAAAAEGAEFVISMVGVPADVEATHLGPSGTLRARKLPAVLIDMTTSQPQLAVRIFEAAKEKGIDSLDAPVSGGDVGARNAALSIMVGGDSATFEKAQPILQLMGKQIVHQGPAGAGQHTKMVNQTLIASIMIGMCEGLLYAKRAGLDPLKVIQSVGSGAAGSWAINNLGPRIVSGDFNPGFYVEHFIKDLGIALDEAKRLGLQLPGLDLANQLYRKVAQEGHGRSGTQALYLTLQAMS